MCLLLFCVLEVWRLKFQPKIANGLLFSCNINYLDVSIFLQLSISRENNTMTPIYMLKRYLWTYRLPDGEHEFFESCELAVRDLISRGLARSDIVIDYESETLNTPRAAQMAQRFVKAYGTDGRRFMPQGELIGVECPPSESEREQRAPRKCVLNCPHCGKPIRIK